jgi:hypothetical protein
MGKSAKEKRLNYYQKLFFIGALWNGAVSITFFFFSNPIFGLLGMASLNYAVIMQLLMSLVFAFGLGYWWVSRDLYNNNTVVLMAIFGKTMIFLVLFYYALMVRNISMVLLTPGIVDLAFAILFLEFLFNKKKLGKKG